MTKISPGLHSDHTMPSLSSRLVNTIANGGVQLLFPIFRPACRARNGPSVSPRPNADDEGVQRAPRAIWPRRKRVLVGIAASSGSAGVGPAGTDAAGRN